MPEANWVVWSFEHDAWWAPNERGYVQELAAAGRYTQARAIEIERMANKHGPENEKAMSLASATALIDGVDEKTLMNRVRAIAADPTRHSPGGVYTTMAREVLKLRDALERIAKGEGAYSRDQLTFAENVIEESKRIARDALGTQFGTQSSIETTTAPESAAEVTSR